MARKRNRTTKTIGTVNHLYMVLANLWVNWITGGTPSLYTEHLATIGMGYFTRKKVLALGKGYARSLGGPNPMPDIGFLNTLFGRLVTEECGGKGPYAGWFVDQVKKFLATPGVAKTIADFKSTVAVPIAVKPTRIGRLRVRKPKAVTPTTGPLITLS